MNLKRKKEKKNSKTNGIKKQKDLKDIPELCFRCKKRITDKHSNYCDIIMCLKPTMLCFKPKNNKSFSNCNKALKLLLELPYEIESLSGSCYDDVRNVPKVLRKIKRRVNQINTFYIKSLSDFKEYLDLENLEFKEKYYHDVKCD